MLLDPPVVALVLPFEPALLDQVLRTSGHVDNSCAIGQLVYIAIFTNKRQKYYMRRHHVTLSAGT